MHPLNNCLYIIRPEKIVSPEKSVSPPFHLGQKAKKKHWCTLISTEIGAVLLGQSWALMCSTTILIGHTLYSLVAISLEMKGTVQYNHHDPQASGFHSHPHVTVA
jgi:hypothetical protein